MTGRGTSDHGTVPYRDAMRALIGERWETLWAALPHAMAGADPEGVHQMRVASRRLRAAMDVATGVFPNDWYRPLHRLAKQVTRELGAVRDRDVLIDALQADRATAPPEQWPGIDLVINRIEIERQAARAEMEHFLAELESSGMIKETRRRFSERGSSRKKKQSRLPDGASEKDAGT